MTIAEQAQRLLGPAALVAAAIAVVGIAARVFELTSYQYLTATVVSLDPYQGECRRPSGRAEKCVLSHALLSYQLPGEASSRSGRVDVAEKGVRLAPGQTLRVAVDPKDPAAVLLPEIRSGWSLWVALLILSGVLALLRMGRRAP